ncbi:MAG: ABC transporter substrate-binding protein [Anaerolineae bacterium]|nr:ABC transporter substrate-binding protein [Anaerolineae bacterium]
MKKATVFALAMLLVAVAALTFVSGSTTALAQAPTITPVPPVPKPEGAVEITFWYGLGGNLGNVVQEVVNKYNSSQSTYYVNAVFQSSYDDTINTINAGLASGNLPNLAQIFEAGSQRMIDTGRTIPVQQFFERDGMMDVIDDMEPAVRANYQIGGTLWSAPFNSSTAMLYIDRAAAAAAGINPDEPMVTFDQVADYARALTVKDANGNTTRYGMGIYGEGWFLEQIHAVHDAFMGTPNNGRAGERMTEYTYNDAVGVQWVEFLKGLVDEGVAVYYGQAGAGQTASASAFANGEVAMHWASIASLRGLLSAAESAGKGVEVGVLYLPRNEGVTGKTIVGGASLWITDVGTTDQQEGAWDFIKFALTPEIQAFWSVNTGYIPVRMAAYEQAEMQAGLEQYPQFQVALNQLRLTGITDANTAHVSGIFVPYRTHYVAAFDQYFTGGYASAQEALDAAVATSNELLAEYNLTVGG